MIGIFIGPNQAIAAENLHFPLQILLMLKMSYIGITGTELDIRQSQELARPCSPEHL